jgi:RNA polymerase sigma-70 factor (ECF subfamily)
MSATEPRDEVLVERARHGDRRAIEMLYDRYVREIYGYVINQLGDVRDAEDVTSETFLRLVRSLDSFGGRSSFRTWLYAIARNQLRDHWRRNGRRPRTVELDPAGTVDPAVAEPAPPNPRASALGREVLARLPENYRRVLELRILDDRSIRDTAEELDLSVANVKVLQHRGLKRAEQIAREIVASFDDEATERKARDGDPNPTA